MLDPFFVFIKHNVNSIFEQETLVYQSDENKTRLTCKEHKIMLENKYVSYVKNVTNDALNYT